MVFIELIRELDTIGSCESVVLLCVRVPVLGLLFDVSCSRIELVVYVVDSSKREQIVAAEPKARSGRQPYIVRNGSPDMGVILNEIGGGV